MEEDEAHKYGFKLSRVVSLTSLLDELKSMDSEAFESRKTLEDWANKSIEEDVSLVNDTISGGDSFRTTKKNNASLNFATASFAISFLKARQAKLAEKKYNEAEQYKNNDVLPSSIPVDIYLESLRALKGQKEHRRVDLFKELRKKKAIQRRDESFKKTITRLKHKDEGGHRNSEKKLKNTAKKTKHHNNSTNMLRRTSKSEALFDQDCIPLFPHPKHTGNQAEFRDKQGNHMEGTTKHKEPILSPYCAPFGAPVTNRPTSRSKNRPKTSTKPRNKPVGVRVTDSEENAVAGAGCSPHTAGKEDDYTRQMEATLSDMMGEHERLVRGDSVVGLEHGSAAKPFGTPLGSRPLCGIYSQR